MAVGIFAAKSSLWNASIGKERTNEQASERNQTASGKEKYFFRKRERKNATAAAAANEKKTHSSTVRVYKNDDVNISPWRTLQVHNRFGIDMLYFILLVATTTISIAGAAAVVIIVVASLLFLIAWFYK